MPSPVAVHPDPQAVARPEAEAARHHRAFRFRLALLAVAGEGVLIAIRVLPWAAPPSSCCSGGSGPAIRSTGAN
jgi:hypothetical protein